MPTRHVPLRIVQLTDCDWPWICGPALTTAELNESVEKANEVYGPAGVQFWIWSNEVYVSPSFAANSTTDYFYWQTVRPEIQAIYPGIPDDAWQTYVGTVKSGNYWLDSAAAFYSDPRVVQVFVHQFGSGSSSLFPWNGRGVQISAGSIAAPPVPGAPEVVTTHLGHELGHYLGLTHPWGVGGWSDGGRLDPSTCSAPQVSDDWDLLRCNNQLPSRTFSSLADWQSYACPAYNTRFLESDQGVSCETSPAYTGRLWCYYGGPDLIDATGTGLAFEDTSVPDNPPTSFRFGINVMLYYGASKTDMRAPAFVSQSQKSTLEKWLTYDCASGMDVSAFLTYEEDWPDGANWNSDWPQRNQLGWGDSRLLWSSNAGLGLDFTFKGEWLDIGSNDVVSGDFDGDSFDDLLYFSNGSTSALVRWGGTGNTQGLPGFFVSPASFTKVFVGDFNGDQRDDVFVYGAGSLGDFMKYGNTNRTFTTYATAVSGSYVPFVGNFDGASGDDIFWYAPSGGYVHRWYSTGGTTFTKLNWFSVPSGGPFTPIVGNFDGASGDDVFWYKPGSGQDKLWYSIGSQSGFANANPTNVYGMYYQAVSGDFDSDGYDDILWHETGNDSIWPGRPQATQFGSPVRTQDMHLNRTPVAGDFNGDSRADIYWK